MFEALLLFSLFCALWTKEVLFPEPPEKKSPEEKLGEAIGKYLASLRQKGGK